jgi:hypothetical protein
MYCGSFFSRILKNLLEHGALCISLNLIPKPLIITHRVFSKHIDFGFKENVTITQVNLINRKFNLKFLQVGVVTKNRQEV